MNVGPIIIVPLVIMMQSAECSQDKERQGSSGAEDSGIRLCIVGRTKPTIIT